MSTSSTSSRSVALFDLDHTLLPIDSDHEWGRFLVRIGVVDREYYDRENERFYNDYKAGKLDIYGFLAFALKPLASHPRPQLDAWHAQFMTEVIEPNIQDSAKALVQHHQNQGDLCCVVTATNSFVTRPIAALFGIDQLIATEPEVIIKDGQPNFTGQVAGLPNFKEGKVTHVDAWLKKQNLSWDTLSSSTFYTDSMNDLPLMEKVNIPVATNPDERLRKLAQENSWRILDLFA
jgi:HAD superfamily hydrolase (TIGR01490 family)